MEYTIEEMRATAKHLHDDITVRDDHALKASDMLTAYADSIERAQPADSGRVIAWMREQASTMHTDNFDCDGPKQNHQLAYAIDDAADRLAALAAQGQLPASPAAVPDGWKLAMFVLQSDIYAKLPAEERAVCDALIQQNPYIFAAPSAPEGDA